MQPSKILNFADAGKLDSTVVFSRASGANRHPGTFYDCQGIMREASYDTPRITYDPVTGVCKGLMVEEARSNVLPYSENFSQAGWVVLSTMTKTGITRAGVGGDMSGYTFTAAAASDSFYTDHYIGASGNGAAYRTASIHIHTSSTVTDATLSLFYFVGGATQHIQYRFNPQTGAFISTNNTATLLEYDCVNCGNGWFRYSISGKGIDTANTYNRFQLYANTGGTLVVDKAQLEDNSTCSSYIPTNGTYLTRPADYAYATADWNDWFDPFEGTMYVEYEKNHTLNRLDIPIFEAAAVIGTWALGRFDIRDYGVGTVYTGVELDSTMPYSANSSAETGKHKQKCVAFAWKSKDIQSAMNGKLFGKSTTSPIPIRMSSTVLSIGCEGPGSFLNGTIKKIILFPDRLPDPQLEQLTQVKEEVVEPSFTLSFSGEGSVESIKLPYASPAGYRETSAGTLQWVPANTNRLDYDKGKCLGLLGEKTGINILPYADVQANGWGSVNFTASANTADTTDPTGANTALKLTVVATSAVAYYRIIAVANPLVVSEVYTLSAYFKKGTAPYFFLGFSDNVDSGCNVSVDVNTLATTPSPFGGWTYITSVVEPKANGWYRVILTAKNNSSDTTTSGYVCHSNHNVNNTGTAGQYGYIWGPQMEAGYVATSFVPNSSATLAATRNADVHYLSTSNKLTNSHLSATYTRSEVTIGAAVEMPYGDVGTPIGFKVVESVNNTYKSLAISTSVVLKTRVLVHTWVVKKADASRPWVYFEGLMAGTRCYCRFNLDTMVFDDFYSSGGATNLSTKAYPLADGWYRIIRVIDYGPLLVLGTTTGLQTMNTVSAAGNTLYTGDGTSGVYTGAWQAYELTDGLTAYEPYTTHMLESSRATSMAWFNPVEGTITKESYRKYQEALTGSVAEINCTLLYSGVGGFYQLRDVRNTKVDGATWPYHDIYCYTGAAAKTVAFDAGNVGYRYGEPVVQTLAYKSGSFEVTAPDYVESFTVVPTALPQMGVLYLGHSYSHCHLQKFTYTPRKYTDRSSTLQLKSLDDVRSPSFQLNYAKSKSADPAVNYYRGDSLPCATIVGNNGKVSVVAANTGRITHSMVDGSCRGLLSEEASTNVIDTDFSRYDALAIVVQGTIIAPDGAICPAFKAKAGVSSFSWLGEPTLQNYTISITNGQYLDYSFSGYFAPYGPLDYKPYIVIAASSTFASPVYALVWFNPIAGTFTSKQYDGTYFTELLAPTATMTESGMWYVTWTVRFTQTATVKNRVACNIQIGDAAYSRTSLMDGLSGFHVWGLQFEQRHTPTSFINNPYSYNTGARSTPATYYNSSGLVATAPTYTARNNYHPNYLTLPPRILYEQAATNYMAYTESFNTWWAPNTVTITANATTAPDGTVSADKMVEDNTSNQHLISQVPSTAVAINEYWTISIFAKAAERTQIFLTAYGEQYSVFDLSNGTIVQAGGSNVCVIEKLPNGWYRCGATIKKSNTTANMYYGIWNGSNVYTGNGTSGLYIWGAQVEAGGAMTSYIPNTGSATSATRAADASIFSGYTRANEQHSMTNTSVTSWYNQYEGTFATRFKVDFPSIAPQYPTILCLSDDTYNNRINISNYNVGSSLGITVVNGGVASYDGPWATVLGQTHTIVAGYKDNRLIVAIDGKVVLDLSSAMAIPKNLKTMHVGNLLGGNFLNGTIEYINYYPVLLTTQEIQQLSCQ